MFCSPYLSVNGIWENDSAIAVFVFVFCWSLHYILHYVALSGWCLVCAWFWGVLCVDGSVLPINLCLFLRDRNDSISIFVLSGIANRCVVCACVCSANINILLMQAVEGYSNHVGSDDNSPSDIPFQQNHCNTHSHTSSCPTAMFSSLGSVFTPHSMHQTLQNDRFLEQSCPPHETGEWWIPS